jgi:hypothetical protein
MSFLPDLQSLSCFVNAQDDFHWRQVGNCKFASVGILSFGCGGFQTTDLKCVSKPYQPGFINTD